MAAASLAAAPAYADSIRDRQWYLQSLKVSQTRSITSGDGVTVAIVDTGTYPHPDLYKNLLNGIDKTKNSGTGQNDADGHGTRIASIVAAHGRGNKGIQGIAPGAKLLPVRVAQSGNAIRGEFMGDGIAWAANHGAKVINVSLAAGPDPDLAKGVRDASARDALVVAGIGNTSTGLLGGYPAKFDGVLAVGATGRDGKFAPISIKDPKVQICAPGVDIASANAKVGYSTANGTSDSTAIVSGAAALVRAKFPELSAKDVINRLTATADDIGPPGRDDECGFGRLNIVKALTADVPPLEGGGTASAATSAAAPALSATTPAAQDEPQPESSATTAVFGVLAVLVVAGVVVAVLVVRRRRRF